MYNFLTKQEYTGANVTTLVAAQMENGYESGAWMTYKQGKEAGYQVRKGEHGVHLKRITLVKDKKHPDKTKKVPRGFVVFNVEQFDKVENESE